ncbi:uncharacterized protein [Paramisgurnus dabryanus]|uniref:uncharacterized protein isoform X3 n=1 Tax=Paramisgurnus dabryanus TaxID=90735 RepID=UPI0031F3D76B
MGVVNVILVLLVCSYTAVCQDITINCTDVTAHVRDEIILTCTVSYLNKGCCTKIYKFINTAASNEDICKKEFSDSCKQESRFSCPYTADKAMTSKFKFFLQSTCGRKTSEFSVSTTVAVKVDTDVTGGGLNKLEDNLADEPSAQTEQDKSALAVIIAVISSFIIIIMAFFLKKKKNRPRPQVHYSDHLSEMDEKKCTCNVQPN